MTDQTQGQDAAQDTAKPETTAVAVQQPAPRREIRVVQNSVPMFDTANFEHLGRVARMMADANLLPMTLTHYKEGSGPNARDIPHEPAVIVARAFMIANQALAWNADPIAVAQCTSLVHNRLMYEGKLVHAIIESNIGVRLNYEFGKWDTDHFVQCSEEETHGIGELLAVRVFGRYADETTDRTVEGSVGQWKTTGAGSPWSVGAYRRQLRYRGAREWARAHAPGILLGIVTDDEMDDTPAPAPRRARGVKTDLRARLGAPPADAEKQEGFDAERIARETSSQKDEEATETKPQEQAKPQEETPHDPETGEILDAEFTEGGDAGEEDDGEEWPSSGNYEGPAPNGIVYQLSTDEIGEDDKCPIYKDGIAYSRVTAKGAAKYPMYDEHAPPLATNEEAPTDAEKAAAAAVGGDDLPDALKGGDTAQGDPQVRTNPEDRQEPEEEQQGGGLMAEIRAMTSWLQVKARLTPLYQSDDWKALEPEDQAAVRANIWNHVETLVAAGDPVRAQEDVSAFRLWMDTQAGAEGADKVEGRFNSLTESEGYKKLKPDQQATYKAMVDAHIAKNRGA